MSSKNTVRRGVVLIGMLACSLTALSLGALAVRLALRSARQEKQTLRVRQADWLLNAGIRRAQEKLQKSEYAGESWEIPQSVTHSESAIVQISLASDPKKIVSIVVEYGNGPYAIHRTVEFVIQEPVISKSEFSDVPKQLYSAE